MININPNVTIIQPIKTEEKTSKIRTAAYCRVSSDSADQLNSFMTQMRYYESFLADSETEILAGVYADEGITGTRMDKRENFQRLLRDCRKGRIDRVITKSISRFARNTKECLSTIRELKLLGITVMFEKENIDTANVTDEMMITIMGGLAQEESTSISQNMRWSIQKRMQNGTYKTARPPFGFNDVNGRLVINNSQAKIVKQIFNMYLNGCGLMNIANELNKNNIPSNQIKGLWTAYVVKYILTNERYIGDTLFQKSYITENLPRLKKRNYGQKQRYYVSDTNPMIVEKETFETVQRLLKERHKSYSNYNHFLSGKVHCAECGVAYRYKMRAFGESWVCRNHDALAESCESKPITQALICEAFIALYNKLKFNYSDIFIPLLSQLQELKNRKFSGNKRYSEIMKEIASMKEQMHVLARLKTKGFLENDKYIKQTAEINSKVENLNRELQKISQCDDEDEITEKVKELASIIESGTELMIDFDEVMFESIVEKIVVKNQHELEFHLYGGLKLREMI